jgi:dihydrolipoyl dehydrogenase
MGKEIEVKVPDIGDFKDVEVIEVLVKPGDTVAKEASLISLESDKATMEIPSSDAGVVKDIKVKVGDKVNQGSVILTLDAAAAAEPAATPKPAPASAPTATPTAAPAAAPAKAVASASVPAAPAPKAQTAAGKADVEAEVVVLGSGPGGYTAAFRAADLGKKVVLIERYATLGGVCLNVGCIPSKALLHAAKVVTETEEMSHFGISFGAPKIDLDKLRGWKDTSVVAKLTKGLAALAKQRKVQVVTGTAKFESPNTLLVDGKTRVAFEHCIIAAGSSVARVPGLPYDDPRLVDSTGALALADIPKRLLVIGGGIIGLEMACVYDALGSKVTVVEMADGLIPGADRDLVRPLAKRIEKRYDSVLLKTKVAKLDALEEGLLATYESDGARPPQLFDRVLLAVGRRPNGREIGCEAAGVTVNERGYIPTDKQMRTNVAHIFAIGDIVGEPMLAHKASHEGKVAAEVIAGHKVAFDALTMPSVAYTDPEIAWMGLTETDAKKRGVEYGVASFPWAASGRALSIGRDEGLTKLLFDKTTRRILGAGIVGVNAGELIAELTLALEMGADMEDIGLTIHPHPTLSETAFFAAEMAEGTITDLYVPKKT